MTRENSADMHKLMEKKEKKPAVKVCENCQYIVGESCICEQFKKKELT